MTEYSPFGIGTIISKKVSSKENKTDSKLEEGVSSTKTTHNIPTDDHHNFKELIFSSVKEV